MSDTRANTQLLSNRQAAERAGVGVSTMRRWGYEQRIPYTKVKNQIFFAPQDIDAFLAARQQAPQTPAQYQSEPPRAAPVHPAVASAAQSTPLLSTKEAAEIAGVDKSTMREWCYKERVPYTYNEYRQIRIARQALERYLATRQQAPQPSGVQTELPWAAQPQAARQPAARPPSGSQPAAQRFAASRPDAVAMLRQERDALRRERDILQRELDAAYDRERVHLRLLEHVYQPAPRAVSTRTLSDRCLEYLREERAAKTAKQVQMGLGLSRSPARALRYLVDRGLVYRAGLGKFQAVPPLPELLPKQTSAPPKKKARPQTKQDRVLAYLRREGRPRLAVQIGEALGLSTTPYDELSRLEKHGVVQKIRPGLWEAVRPGRKRHTEGVSAEEA